MPFKTILPCLALAALAAGCSGQSEAQKQTQASYSEAQKASITVTLAEKVSYQPLNPARGDASPQAGVLWGDITKDVPSGMLLQFADGFSSPPHIHNITYRAVVIKGEIHNDDPEAANMWMGPGTYWSQPAGEVHITSAQSGVGGTGFLEILEGPYLVQPGDEAFDNGERPLNLIPSNMVWMGPDQMNWIKTGDGDAGPEASLLWGDLSSGKLSASMIKLPKGYKAELSTTGGDLRAVVIKGNVSHAVTSATDKVSVKAGGYFASDAGVSHSLACGQQDECLIYVRTDGNFLVQ